MASSCVSALQTAGNGERSQSYSVRKLTFQPLAQDAPELGCEFCHHDFDDRDIVPLGLVAAAP